MKNNELFASTEIQSCWKNRNGTAKIYLKCTSKAGIFDEKKMRLE